MARSRLTLNHRTVQQYLDGDHGVEAMLTRRGERALATARANAPVVSGDYRNGLHLEVTHTDRMVVRVVSDVDYTLAVEADTGNLARALDSAGGV